MNLRFLETFVWVARLRSFSLAAEKLRSTQAAVSHRIGTLERELGIRLFERDARDVRLTPQGADALDYAERIVRLAAEFRQRVSNPEELRGTLRIGVIDTVAQTWLPQLIERASVSYPQIRIELDADQSVGIAERLGSAQADLGLLMGPVLGPGVVNIDLCAYGCVWVAAPKLAVEDAVLDTDDLARFPILAFPRASKPHIAMLAYFQRCRAAEVRLHTSNSLSTLIRLATDGVGIAAVPAPSVERELRAGALRVLRVRQPFPPIQLHAAYVESEMRPVPALLAEMAREIAEAFCAARDPGVAWSAAGHAAASA